MDLRVGYDGRPAIERLSGTMAEGSLTAVVGANGAGKTTLLRTIVGLLKPLSGRVELGGLPPGSIAYLPQHAEIDRSFPVAVGDVVMLGHWRRSGAFAALGGAARRTAERALAEVGLEGLWRRPIGTLSQGQLQRVLLARILVQDCPVILLDEPFASRRRPHHRRPPGDRRPLAPAKAARSWRSCTIWSRSAPTFPETLLLARSCIAWGRTARVLTQDNLLRAWGVPAGRDGRCDDPRPSVAPAA